MWIFWFKDNIVSCINGNYKLIKFYICTIRMYMQYIWGYCRIRTNLLLNELLPIKFWNLGPQRFKTHFMSKIRIKWVQNYTCISNIFSIRGSEVTMFGSRFCIIRIVNVFWLQNWGVNMKWIFPVLFIDIASDQASRNSFGIGVLFADNCMATRAQIYWHFYRIKTQFKTLRLNRLLCGIRKTAFENINQISFIFPSLFIWLFFKTQT